MIFCHANLRVIKYIKQQEKLINIPPVAYIQVIKAFPLSIDADQEMIIEYHGYQQIIDTHLMSSSLKQFFLFFSNLFINWF